MTCRTCTTHWLDPAGRAIATMAVLALAACSAGGGPERTEERGVDAFHSVDLRGSAEVLVEVGPASALTITAPEGMLQKIGTEVQNGMLIIEQRRSGWSLFGNNGRIKLHITLPTLNAFAANGAAGVKITGVKDSPLALVMQGAGSIEASGVAESLNARMNGAGDMNLAGLTATDATVV